MYTIFIILIYAQQTNFTLTNLKTGTSVELLNTLGQVVFSELINTPTNATYSVEGLATGIYHVRLEYEGALRSIKMVVK
jgi:hypothetical protein